MENIEFKEIIELFLHISIYQIKSETEVPNVNFKFNKEAIQFFENVVTNPYIKNGSWTPNAEKNDIEFVLYQNNDDCPTISVHDSFKFFKSLMDITNSLIRLYEFYGIHSSARNLSINIMRRIWLRMGIEDIQNVELFLEKQLQFVNNRTFDIHNIEKIGAFYDYDVFMQTIVNRTFDETTRSMVFTIKNNVYEYELPHILYDIDNDGTCYIYGIQNVADKKSKIIERKLYKLNKNIDNPNVHPSKVYALILFVDQLRKKGISKIIVPGMQILSYRYHELLSEKTEKDLIEVKKQLEESCNANYLQERYKAIKKWYDRVYNNQDKISYLKTEELFNIFYRIIEHDSNIEITNEINLQGDSLNVKVRK